MKQHPTSPEVQHSAREYLAAQGLVETSSWQPTRRWHGALARAAGDLVQQGQSGEDIRVPITLALLQQLGDQLDEQQLVAMVEHLLPYAESGAGPH